GGPAGLRGDLLVRHPRARRAAARHHHEAERRACAHRSQPGHEGALRDPRHRARDRDAGAVRAVHSGRGEEVVGRVQGRGSRAGMSLTETVEAYFASIDRQDLPATLATMAPDCTIEYVT